MIGLAAFAVIGPLVAFAIGWLVFPVPKADDIAVTQVATFTYTDGAPLATVRPDNVNRTSVDLSQVPVPVQQAVLSAEDRTFFSNPGFDITGIARAVINQLSGGIGGGSTITQQYIKVTTGNDQYSLFRKFREVVLAAKMSKEMTKEQILGNYLNAIYLGRGAYGIQAASQAYFGKNVQDLNASEGAMIAGLIQSPSRWDPAKNLEMSQQRWNFVLDGMVTQGWMTQADRAQQRFPQWREASAAEGGGIPGDDKGHIYNAARAELEKLGISETEINTQGLTVTTTIDPKAQEDAATAVKKVMDGQPGNLRSSLVSVNPKTGAVIAYFGGRTVSASTTPRCSSSPARRSSRSCSRRRCRRTRRSVSARSTTVPPPGARRHHGHQLRGRQLRPVLGEGGHDQVDQHGLLPDGPRRRPAAGRRRRAPGRYPRRPAAEPHRRYLAG
nr:transglycosylase domain-containing protein [Pseudonocardia sp. AL041005-10]